MKVKTTIDGPEFTFSIKPNFTIFGLNFNDNEKISFLPVHVRESFPNLNGITAERCSIQSISKDNFRYLVDLKLLNLNSNRIESFDSDVFEHLTSLEELYLGMNFYSKSDLMYLNSFYYSIEK